MIPMRQSGAKKQNDLLVAQEWEAPGVQAPAGAMGDVRPAAPPEGNQDWLGRMKQEHGLGEVGDVILLGGASIIDFRVRVAQSQMRHDLTPSYWSTVGVLDKQGRLVTVPLAGWANPAAVPATNAIATLPMSRFDDADRYPNIAILRFPGTTADILDGIEALKTQRSVADLPALVLDWLHFVWAAGDARNPLVQGSGVPSAVMVELAFSLINVEVTPGLASASSCPEAVWQSVKWWQDFYTQAVAGRPEGTVPSADNAPWGHYVTRQKQASYLEPTRR
jgi:hypothetical protein